MQDNLQRHPTVKIDNTRLTANIIQSTTNKGGVLDYLTLQITNI